MIRTYFLEFYIMTDSLPDWTGVVQATAAILGTAFAIITVWKLVARDKKRESEIESLSVIASELKNMMVHNQKIFTDSKKPQIEASIHGDGFSYDRFLKLKNVNHQSRLTNFKIIETESWGKSTFPISVNGTTQEFSLSLKFKNGHAYVKVEYEMDAAYRYSQNINIWMISDFEDITFRVAPENIEQCAIE